MTDVVEPFLAATIRTAVPLALAALGELLVERTGLINIGLEGAILAGAFGALVGVSSHGVALGFMSAMAAGLIVGLLFVAFVVWARADQIITGTALTLLSMGATGTLYRAVFGSSGVALSIPTSAALPIPGLAGLPVVGPALFSQPPITYLVYLLAPALAWWLARTHAGLALRAIGDRPDAAEAAGIAVDGAHIYEPTEEGRRANRQRAYRWLQIADKLGAEQVRIDAGGPEDMPDEAFGAIVAGYNDLIKRARPMGIEILFENHWGPTVIPDNCVRLCESIDGLGMLLDTHNWKDGLRDEGRRKCAKFAKATHIKTLNWEGEREVGENAEEAIKILQENGYRGAWGIESVPVDGDEYAGARKTIDLIRRCVGE